MAPGAAGHDTQGEKHMNHEEARIERAAYGLWVATGHRPSDWAYIAPETARKQRYLAYAKATLAAADEAI